MTPDLITTAPPLLTRFRADTYSSIPSVNKFTQLPVLNPPYPNSNTPPFLSVTRTEFEKKKKKKKKEEKKTL